MTLNYSIHNIADVVESAVLLCYDMASNKGLTLCWFIEPSLPPALLMDSTRLQQVLLNLLSNAIKVNSATTNYVSLHSVRAVVPRPRWRLLRAHVAVADFVVAACCVHLCAVGVWNAVHEVRRLREFGSERLAHDGRWDAQSVGQSGATALQSHGQSSQWRRWRGGGDKNGRKQNQEESVLLTASWLSTSLFLSLSFFSSSSSLIRALQDTGIGVTPEQLAKLFKSFSQSVDARLIDQRGRDVHFVTGLAVLSIFVLARPLTRSLRLAVSLTRAVVAEFSTCRANTEARVSGRGHVNRGS